MHPITTVKGAITAGVRAGDLFLCVSQSHRRRCDRVSSLVTLAAYRGGRDVDRSAVLLQRGTGAGLADAAADKGGPGGAGISKYIAPRALWWFRWAAVVTWLTGAYYLLFGYGPTARLHKACTAPMTGYLVDRHRRLARHDHAVQRLGPDLAEPEEDSRHRSRRPTRRRRRPAKWRCYASRTNFICPCRC